jgi:hypothetical protein
MDLQAQRRPILPGVRRGGVVREQDLADDDREQDRQQDLADEDAQQDSEQDQTDDEDFIW